MTSLTDRSRRSLIPKLLLTAVAGLWALLCTQWLAADTLNIVVTNVPASEGRVMLQILAGEAQFKGEAPAAASVMQQAQEGRMSFSTANLPAGQYAFRVMHDRNGNGELDANFVGMPTEPWAFSNNAAGNFGPPTWEDCRFTLDGVVEQSIQLNF